MGVANVGVNTYTCDKNIEAKNNNKTLKRRPDERFSYHLSSIQNFMFNVFKYINVISHSPIYTISSFWIRMLHVYPYSVSMMKTFDIT